MPWAAEHVLGQRLVHAQRRRQHAGADVGHAGQLEQALHGAVLAHRPVEQRQHDDLLAGAGGRTAGSGSISGRPSATTVGGGQRGGAGLEGGDGVAGRRPTARRG